MENTPPSIDLQAAWKAGLIPHGVVPLVLKRRPAVALDGEAVLLARMRRGAPVQDGSLAKLCKNTGWSKRDTLAKLCQWETQGDITFSLERDDLLTFDIPTPPPAAPESACPQENAPEPAPAPMNGCEYHPEPHDYDPEEASAALAETSDPLDGHPFFDSDDVQLRQQWRALHMVWERCRDLGEDLPFVLWARNLGIDLKTVYDRVERGNLLASRYTSEDDEHFRATFGKFLPIVPNGETGPECDARRRAFKYALAKEEAMEQQHAYTRPDLPRVRNLPTVDHAGRLAALLAVLPPTAKSTIKQAARKVRPHPAWLGPDGKRMKLASVELFIRRMRVEHEAKIGSAWDKDARSFIIWRR